MYKRLLIFFSFLLLLSGCSFCHKCILQNLITGDSSFGTLPPNFSEVKDIPGKKIYRSGNLKKKHIERLMNFGVVTIITLNNTLEEVDSEIQKNKIYHVELDLSAGDLTVECLKNAVNKILTLPGPILVHCRAGADRTGMVIAALRIHFGERSKEKLFKEMRENCHVTWREYEYFYKIIDDLIRKEVQNDKK